MRLGKDARKRTNRIVRNLRRVSQRITRQKRRPVKRARQTAAKSAKKSFRELTAPQVRLRRQARMRLRAEQPRPRSSHADTLFAAVQRLVDDQLFVCLKRHGNHRWTMHPLFVGRVALMTYVWHRQSHVQSRHLWSAPPRGRGISSRKLPAPLPRRET